MALMRNVGDFVAFSPEHSQYLTFFFDGSGLVDLVDLVTRNDIPCARFSMYIFIYSIHVLLLVIKIYDWMKKALYTVYILGV